MITLTMHRNRMNIPSITFLAALVVTLGVSLTTVSAQVQPQPELDRDRISIFGNYAIGLHSSNFRELGVGNCCPEFTSASGSGLFFGLGYITPLSPTLDLSIRAHYGMFNAAFNESEVKEVVLSNGIQSATIAHIIDADFSQISIEPLLGYHVTRDFVLQGGLTAGFFLSSVFSQEEQLETPTDGAFVSRDATGNAVYSRVRNKFNGDIANVSSFGVGLTVGARYDLPATANRSVLISPEVLFTYNPMSLVSAGSWNAHHLRFGIGVSLAPPEIEDEQSDAELYMLTRATPRPVKGAPGVPFVALLSVAGLTAEGTTSGATTIRVEEFASTRVRPLLPYIFFEQGSAQLPERYRRLREQQVESFEVGNFYNLDAMVTYHHVLNIIGKRMLDNPSATLSVTGCSDASDADASGSIAFGRADIIKQYLVDIWGIESRRVSVERRGLPELASNASEADGRAENRRAELRASMPEILAPVGSQDTMRVFTPAGLRFTPSIDPRVPIASWTLFVADGDRILRTWHNGDPLPSNIDWRLEEQSRLFSPTTNSLEYVLATRDSSGTLVPSGTASIPVQYVSIDSKRSSGADKSMDRFSMILFGFDKSDLSPAHQTTVNDVKSLVKPTSSVRVVGYTDRSGSDDYNQRLSEQRARSVARALGVSESQATGLGKRFPLYDNATPEGRFYSRTVEVFVETPSK